MALSLGDFSILFMHLYFHASSPEKEDICGSGLLNCLFSNVPGCQLLPIPFQVKLPSTISLDVDLLRNQRRSEEFDYSAKGKVVIDDKDYNVNTYASLCQC